MASTFKVSPERFRHLAQLIQTATKTQDWLGIKRYDLQLRELLETHQSYLNDSRLAPAINEARSFRHARFVTLVQSGANHAH